MTRSFPALVEPSVLRWARESIGLTTLAASRRMDFKEDRVVEWESGTVAPTVAQLRKAATVYKRPLGVFYLAAPPTSFDAMRDFRRLDEEGAGTWSPDLHGEYRRALTQREYALELDELEDIVPSTEWRVDIAGDAGDEAIGALARQTLLANGPLTLPSTRPSASPFEHLNAWVSALEEVGVLVLTTRGGRVSPKEMRGFSLYYDQLPVIMVNGGDSPRARTFTLLHEYAHLLLHTAGLCDTITDTSARTPDRRIEARCNAIAAAALMPASSVLARPEVEARRNLPESWDYEALAAAAGPFGVSVEAFLRRLLTLGRTTLKFYRTKRDEFIARYEQEATRSAGGGNWYRNTARDLGKGYVRRVADAHERRVIDTYTAATYLDVKAGQIPRLAREAALQVPA